MAMYLCGQFRGNRPQTVGEHPESQVQGGAHGSMEGVGVECLTPSLLSQRVLPKKIRNNVEHVERNERMPSVMQRIGTPNPRHNKDLNYRKKLENVDPSLSKYNEIIREIPLEQIYEEKVQPAFDAFNKRQRRKDRRLDVKWNCTDALGYQRALDKAAQESKNKIDQKGRPPIREIVWQFGNPEQGYGSLNQTDESRVGIKEMLLECQLIAEERYPQLVFGDVVFHADEVTYDAEENLCGSLHLHSCFVPLCFQNKQGPDVQVAFERCLREMGFPTFESWKHDLDDIMETVLVRHGLERTIMGNTDAHQESSQWHRQQRVIRETKALEAKLKEKNLDFQKAVSEEIESKIEDLPEHITRKSIPMNKEKVVVAVQDLEDLERRANYVAAAKETENSAKAQVAELLSQAEKNAEQIQQEAAAAANQIIQSQQRAWEEIDTERERLRKLGQKLDAVEYRLSHNLEQDRNYTILQSRVKTLELEVNRLHSNETEIVNKAVEKAIRPLQEQMKEKDKQIEGLQTTIEHLQMKLKDATRTVADIISTVVFVAKRFAGSIGESLLNAAANIGGLWLAKSGSPEYNKATENLPKTVAKELQLDLKYLPAKKMLCTYDGTPIAKVDSLKDARERFSNCRIKMQDYELSR